MQTSIGLDDELDVPGERQRDVKDISQVCSMNNWVDIDAFDEKRKYIWRKIISFVLYGITVMLFIHLCRDNSTCLSGTQRSLEQTENFWNHQQNVGVNGNHGSKYDYLQR